MTVDYVYVAATTVDESAVNLTEGGIQAQYDRMEPELQHPEQVRVSYVMFPRLPRAADSAAIEEEAHRLRREIVDAGAGQGYGTGQSGRFNSHPLDRAQTLVPVCRGRGRRRAARR